MQIDPNQLAADYARMGEVELLELARAYDSLTEVAQTALRDEFARRHLEPPLLEESEDVEDRRRLVTIRRYRDLSEAIVARSMLESAGLYVFLRDENLVRLDWQVSNFIGGIRLQVDARDEAAALDLLSQAIPKFIPFDEEDEYVQPQCPRCGSTDITFEGSSRGPALASLTLLALPLPLGHETWLCHSCELRWEDHEEGFVPGDSNFVRGGDPRPVRLPTAGEACLPLYFYTSWLIFMSKYFRMALAAACSELLARRVPPQPARSPAVCSPGCCSPCSQCGPCEAKSMA